MASYQDKVSFIPSSPKLPDITSGGVGNYSSSRRQSATQWIGPLKQRIDYSISYSGSPHSEDVEELSREVVKTMISALQPSASKQVWLDLNHIINVVTPYKDFLHTPSMSHYVERLYLFYNSNMEKLFDVPIVDSLSQLFPYDIERLRAMYGGGAGGAERFVRKILTQPIAEMSPTRETDFPENDPPLVLPDGRNPYTLVRRGEEPESFFKAKPLTFSTINDNLGHVAMEAARNESLWKEAQSTTVAAIKVDLPMMFEHVSEPSTSHPHAPFDRVPSKEMFDFSHLRKSTSPRKKSEEFISMTGRQAVELFLKHKHMHKVKFIYLNKIKNRHFRPYDLVSVPREQLDNEHFIFSSFGVLHIYPDGNHSDTLTLADWNKHAVLWGVLQKIPFFRNYLINKTFHRWLSNVKRLRYNRLRKRISLNLLHNVPDFGSSLLHVFRLIHELSEVRFLTEKRLDGSPFTVVEFESDNHRLRLDAKAVLGLFFQYCKKVVDTTRQSCFEQLKYFEHQAKHTKPLFCKESLYIQRRKREARAKNLQKAQITTRRIPSFVILVDQAISVHLVALAREAIVEFVETLLGFSDGDEEANDEETMSTTTGSHVTSKDISSSNRDRIEPTITMFSTKFGFNRQSCCLEMQPSLNKFQAVMHSSIEGIIDLVCHEAYSMQSVSVMSDSKRPGSAPASVGSSGSENDVSERSSRSSMISDFDSVTNNDVNDAAHKLTHETPADQRRQQAMHIVTGLTDPTLSPRPLPTKQDDADGIVTPEMMASSGPDAILGMMVGGQSLMGNFNPLDQSKLRERMLADPEISTAVAKQEELVRSAVEEVSNFCEEQNEWLFPIYKFVSTWNELEYEKWKGRPARVIEEQLNVIKSWIEKVKNMERLLLTRNKLLYVDCRAPYTLLIPALNNIFKKLISAAVLEAQHFALEVTSEAKDALKILKNKNTDMKSFAEYARKVTDSQKRKDGMTEKVTYIRSLYEVVRMTYRQLTQDEEKLEERVKSTWEAFLYQLKDATNFVANQRPIIMKQLDTVFQAQYNKAEEVAKLASSGNPVNPNANSNDVIIELTAFISEFNEIHKRLIELSHYRESVCGEQYNLVDLQELKEEMETRLNLWKFSSISEYTIAEWKATTFRKFNVQTAMEKIQEWRQNAASLVEQLPPDDVVLIGWNQSLDKMARELPLLHKLSNDAMKSRHWKEVFTGMGETFAAEWTFTVEELLAYKPSQYTNTINRIHRNASAEYSLEQLLRKIKRRWEERQFQLAKHIYIVQNFHQDSDTTAIGMLNANRNLDKKLFDELDSEPLSQEKDSETFILVGVVDLLRDVSDSHVMLQGMLQSKHAVEVKGDAEIWSDTLQQIGEVVNLWVSCQDKWMYLTKIFQGEVGLSRQFSHLKPQFDAADLMYREYISATSQDPKVLSVMSRLHGQKGWREMQGEVLRKHLISCIKIEEEVLYGISTLLENFRTHFPRLYFLCDEDCVRLLGISRQPKALIPYVRKCFSSIRSVTFTLPKGDAKQARNTKTSLVQELHSHKLEVTGIVGNYKESVDIEPLESHTDATMWLRCLDDRIKESLRKQLKNLIEFKLQKDVSSVLEAMNDVFDLEAIADEDNPQTAQYRHWLLKYPCQVNLLADAVLWFGVVKKYFKSGASSEDLERIKKETVFHLKQLGQAMQDSLGTSTKTSVQRRLQSVLSALITQTVYHRDILSTLEKCGIKTTSAYEWQSIIKYSADVVDYSEINLKLEEEIEGYPHSSLTKTAVAGNCYIDQLGHKTDYGYEYYGIRKNSDTCVGAVAMATVVTPMTERCSVNLAITQQLGRCGGLFGPSSVGKSLVISELARAFGRHFINLSSSEDLSIALMKRTLCGMVETGSWLCFDHAEHLKHTTLSILSQYIKQIQDAYFLLKQSFNTKYTVHGNDGNNRLKRSNSVTTLHTTVGPDVWCPQVLPSYLHQLNNLPIEEIDLRPQMDNRKGIGNLAFDNKLLKVKEGFGLFMTFTTQPGCQPEIPDSLKVIYRPTCLIKPDEAKLMEVWLQAAGFMDAKNLSQKLHLAFQFMRSNVDYVTSEGATVANEAASIASLGLNNVRSIISLAARLFPQLSNQQRSRGTSMCESDTGGGGYPPSSTSSATSVSRSSRRSEMILASHNEELALVHGLLITYKAKLTDPQILARLKENLKTIFPMVTQPLASKDQDTKLAGTIQQQMVTDGLQPSEEWINKACQLYTLLKLKQSVVIAGAAGSGKTTICRVLSKALNSLGTEALIDVALFKGKSTSQSGQTFGKKSLKSGVSTSASEFIQSDVFEAFDEDTQCGYGGLLDTDSYGRVDITTLFPNAHTNADLFGFHKPKSRVWKNGLLVKLLKECTIIHKVGSLKKDKRSESLQPSAGRQKSAGTDIMKSMPSLKKWIVMDGEIQPSWVDNISCLLDDHKRAHLSNIDDISLPTSTNFIFEVDNFSSASPAIATRCAIMHCSVPQNWRNVITTWLDGAYSQYALTQSTIKVWREMVEDLVPPILKFLSQNYGSLLQQGMDYFYKTTNKPCSGIHEITSFMSILSSCLTSHMFMRGNSGHQEASQDDVTIGKRSQQTSPDDARSTRTGASGIRSRLDDAIPDSHHQIAINLFAFSFVWAFGGSLPENEMQKFDQVVKEVFDKSRHNNPFPSYETVYDYFVDEEFGRFSMWEDKIDLRPRGVMQDGSQYIPLHQLERYAHISSILLSNQHSVLLVGDRGSGKSSLVKNLLQSEHNLTKISVSPGLTASHFQRLIESKALPSSKQHNLGLMAHPNAVIASRSFSKFMALFFLDDVSCARCPGNGGSRVQPTLELLRQILSLNGVYELERLLFKSLEADIAFVATATTPGSPGSGLGKVSQSLSPRLTRNFTVLHFLKPGKDAILSMYHSSVQSWLEEFPAYSLVRHYDLSQAIIAGAYDLYSTVVSHLKPTPNQPHYVFSLHDIGHIMQGLFLLTPRTRGRPMPIRRRPGGAEQLRRPAGGRQIGRFRSNRGWGVLSIGSAPMMRTVVRLWLHECCRVFHDRLTTDQDRHWFSRTLHDQLKKHFCTDKEHPPASPGVEKVRIVKTPVPSGGATPMPSISRTSGSTEIIPSSSLGGNDTDIYIQSSPENGIFQAGYDADQSTDTESIVSHKVSEVTVNVTEIQEPMVVTSTSGESSSVSVNKESDFYETDDTTSPFSKMETSTSSNTTKELHIKIPSASSLQDTSIDDVISETTTTQMKNEMSTTSDDFESRPATEMTQDEDGKSTMTGYTTEIETATGSVITMDESSDSDSSTEITAAQINDEKPTTQIRFSDAPLPSEGARGGSVNKTKPKRPQHGGGAKVSRPGGAKLGVTFVPGLIDDADADVNSAGPLMNLNQVLDDNEESTSILFTHGILSVALEQKNSDAYTESTEEQLSGALKLCLEQYNKNAKTAQERMNLVFFGQAVRHIARLSRALWMKRGGHALLLASSCFTGRRSLTKLLAYLCNASVFTVASNGFSEDDQQSCTRMKFRKLVKEASYKAGIENAKVVLVVDQPFSSNTECLDDVCALIKEGQCPALYSHTELAKIAAEIAPAMSSVKTTSETNVGGQLTSLEKLDQFLDGYFARILNNLHVVVLAEYPATEAPSATTCGESSANVIFGNMSLQKFHDILRRCPDLLTQFSCIDLYRAWDHQSWQMVAQYHLQSYAGLLGDDYITDNEVVKIPWSKQHTISNQILHTSHLMAHMHQDALSQVKALLPGNAEELANPFIFQQMVQMFVGISTMVRSKEIQVIQRYEQALKKVREAEDSMYRYHNDREHLHPKLDEARATERAWKRHVEEERQEYGEARQRCTIEEENIEILEKELERLKFDTNTASSKSNPLFQVAQDALNALDESSLNEIKRYKNPPPTTVLVVNCLCHMFGVSPANWENGKVLINRDKFFQDIEFYDKDNIPENIYCTMMKFVHSPEFLPSNVVKGSKAASMLCSWIHAVFRYAEILRYLEPILDAQKVVEMKLEAAQVTLGTKRVRCNQIKQELDSKIQMHKNASISVKHFEKELKNLDTKIAKAEVLMENMQEHVDHWRELRGEAASRLESAIGDSAIVAACVTYFGSMNTSQRALALDNWTNAAVNAYLDQITGGFSVPLNVEKPRDVLKGREIASSTSKSDSDSLWDDIEDVEASDDNSSDEAVMFLKVRPSLIPADILSTPSEQRMWHRSGLSRDVTARFNALRLYALSLYQDLAWCLIYDPDNQALTWLRTIHKRVRKDMESIEPIAATPALDQSRPPTSSQSGSLGIIEDVGGQSSSLSNPANTEDVQSSTGTEVTISVSASGTVRSEAAKLQTSPQSGKGVRFADEDVEQLRQESTPQVMEEIDVELNKESALEEPDDNHTHEPMFPLDELWVCKSTDPKFPKCLASASLHGASLYISHTEQTQLPDICVNRNMAADVHPNFRLYLGISIPMNVAIHRAPGLYSPPVHKLLVTDLSLNQDGLLESLEHIVLDQERSEFEAQRRLMEADVFHLEEHLEQLEDNLLSRVAGVSGAILSDGGMLNALQTYKKDTNTTTSSLHETKLMENNLMQKKFDLSFVASHGLRLFNAYQTTAIINKSLYQFSASEFILLFAKCLKSHVRGKSNAGNSGAGTSGSLVRSRVLELKQGLTESIMDLAERKMFKADMIIFMTLVALNQMVATGKMSEQEMNDFIGSEQKTKRLPIAENLQNLYKPAWMPDNLWHEVLHLTQNYPKSFGNLAWSISTQQKRWQEYLYSAPVLLGKVPCNKLHYLTIGQKALLWKSLQPEVLHTVVHDMTTSVLGGVAMRKYIFDLDNVMEDLSRYKPCCFILPKEGCDCHPDIHILEKAKSQNIICIERTPLFNDDLGDVLEECMIHGRWLLLHNCHLATTWPKKFLQLLTYMTNQMQEGGSDETEEYGKVATPNAHLSLLGFKSITVKTSLTNTQDMAANGNPEFTSDDETTIDHKAVCHKDFRLWLVARNKDTIDRDLPMQIVQNSHLITLDLPSSHKDLVKMTHRLMKKLTPSFTQLNPISSSAVSLQTKSHVPYNVRSAITHSNFLPIGKRNLILQLSMLHGILISRTKFGKTSFATPCKWEDTDLVSQLECVMMARDISVAKRLTGQMLSSQISDAKDVDIAQMMIDRCMVQPKEGVRYRGLAHDIQNLLKHCRNSESGFDVFLQKCDMNTIGLHPSADTNTVSKSSQRLSNALLEICEDENRRLGNVEESQITFNMISAEGFHIKRTVESFLLRLKETNTPVAHKHILSPVMMEFYSSEVVKLKSVIDMVTADLNTCMLIMKGEMELTAKHLELINSIIPDKIPSTWSHDYAQLFRFHSSDSLSNFVNNLDTRVILLHKYMEVAAEPDSNFSPTAEPTEATSRCSSATQTIHTYNLAVFTRPDLFFTSIVFSVAKSKYHDPSKYTLKKEFITRSDETDTVDPTPATLPFETIHVEGLYLHNASFDRRTGNIQESRSQKLYKMPPLRVKTEKLSHYKRCSTNDNVAFSCPVRLCSDKVPDMSPDRDIITYVPMATDDSSTHWLAKGTSLLCHLNEL